MPHQVGHEFWEPSEVALRPPVLQHNVLALDPAALPQAEPEGLPQMPVRRVRSLVRQDTDAVHLPRLLRLGGERRGEEAGQSGSEECPPVHHSIT